MDSIGYIVIFSTLFGVIIGLCTLFKSYIKEAYYRGRIDVIQELIDAKIVRIKPNQEKKVDAKQGTVKGSILQKRMHEDTKTKYSITTVPEPAPFKKPSGEERY